MQRRERGFTLIELMIAVVIIGILASIAYPLYTGYVERARRTDGQAGLMNAAQQLERCYTVQSSYAGCTFSTASPDGHYAISRATESNTATFTLSANYTGGGDDGCANDLTLDHRGVRGPDACW
ncbi:type IV pilus assembly protein PilE [Modicisalibacter xianhensis]|uniref:Type IV pilus assembly protein PilE n=1 Tax=Modicisalibacter xianhensis TaxID=442341 RepID=A0A4R8FKI4_9GAMM|nr:type IV pilin protein [Halomonas xianhensis]TDX24205.1 type IV pilus assembly protein PilE [Halomonas xianhensis]